MKLYVLYSEKQKCLMATSVSSNGDAEHCNEVTVDLVRFYKGDDLWVTTTKESSERIVQKGQTEWFNSGFESPWWDAKDYGDLKVVCLNDFELKE